MSNGRGGYIGVDFDGTLAVHEPGSGVDTLGEPIPAMVERVKGWLQAGEKVRIITARVADKYSDRVEQAQLIQAWCVKYIGTALKVQAHKCGSMYELWDDRAVGLVRNTGLRADQVAVDTAVGKILTWIESKNFDPSDTNTAANIMDGIMSGAWKK